jgi:hypothetical protein
VPNLFEPGFDAEQDAPGSVERGLWQIFRSADAVDYMEGEEPPGG